MMNENYNDPYFDEEEEDIDWAKYIGRLIKNWRKIAIVTFVAGCLGIVVALCQKREYKVSVVVAPEASGGSRGGSSLGSLASMVGINLGSMGSSGADALNISLFPEIVQSTPFLTQLFEVELNPMPKLPKNDPVAVRRILDGPLPSVNVFDHITKRDQEKGGFMSNLFGGEEEIVDPDYLLVNGSRLSWEQKIVVDKLKSVVSAETDKKTQMTTISVTLDDPLMSAQLADTVCRRLTQYVYDYRTEKERRNFAYYEQLCDSAYRKMVEAQNLYADAMDSSRGTLLQRVSVRQERLQQEAEIATSVYQQMVAQREVSRAQLQEIKPVFAIVEPATMPLRPMKSRKNTCIAVTFIGFLLASVWFAIGEEWYFNLLNMVKTMSSEENTDELKK